MRLEARQSRCENTVRVERAMNFGSGKFAYRKESRRRRFRVILFAGVEEKEEEREQFEVNKLCNSSAKKMCIETIDIIKRAYFE